MSRPPRDIDPDATTRDDLVARGKGPAAHEAETVVDGSAAAEAQRPVPERVGPYRVDAVLGEGGMGFVARGYDEQLDRPVALKFLSSRSLAGDLELGRVQREGRLLQAVRHPHVLPLLAVAEHEALPVLVLELAEGGALDEKLQAGALSLKDTLRLCAQVASALAEAHRLGIVHRDLKPANVLLDAEGHAKVSDFGLASRVADATTTRALASETVDLDDGVLSGTPLYMSPEHLSGAEPSPTDDVWALGCVLHECLTGERPKQPGRAPVSQSSGAPPVVVQLIDRCFARRADERFADGEAALNAIRDAHAAVFGEDLPEIVANEGAVPASPSRRLPRVRSRFVGREKELIGIEALVRNRQLVTLTGAGGSGKTRLALEAGSRLEEDETRFESGTAFVELATLEESGSVASRLVESLGISEQAAESAFEAVLAQLRDAALLLVFDNCEHVLDQVRELLPRLLDECPAVRVLATSREPLKLENEGVLPIDPLPLPEEGESDLETLRSSDAVALFVDRARQARYGFELDDESAPWVARCCRRLDGIPLALELAAARLRTEELASLVEQLEADLGRLEGGSRAALPRHQALHATIDWSVKRLQPEERELYRRLGVFAGAFTLELAEKVGEHDGLAREDVLPVLVRLVEQSLLSELTEGAVAAWRMLVPVREHASEQLDASGGRDAARAALISAVTELAIRSKPRFDTNRMHDAVAELSVQHATVVAAANACVEIGDAESGLTIFSGLHGYWHLRELWRDALELGERLFDLAGELPIDLRAAALLARAQLVLPLGDIPAAEELLVEAVDLLRSTEEGSRSLALAEALNTRGLAASERMELERAAPYSEEALEIALAAGSDAQALSCLNQLGKVASLRGEQDAAREYFERALELQRNDRNAYALGAILTNLGVVAIRQEDLPAARTYLQEALASVRECESLRGELFVILNLAAVASREKQTAESLDLHRRALRLAGDLSDHGAALLLMGRFAHLAIERCEFELAARILGAAEALRVAAGMQQFQNQADHDAWLARLRDELDDETFEREHAAGRALDLAGAIATADRVGR